MKTLITLLLCTALLDAYSQSVPLSATVNGLEGGKPVPNATVTLQKSGDSTYYRATTTDSLGFFRITADSGSYNLRITAIGFVSHDTSIRIASTPLHIGIIRIVQGSDLLEEVVVKATPAPVRQKGDTVEYNAGSYKVNPDANAEDMVRKMPGITIEQGAVKAGGENVKKVTVDGRDFFGDDASAALRNLPAEIIDKIQVFDRMSEQAQLTGFEDDETTKGINIVTKANMRNGQFGRVYAGYGTDDRYSAGGNVTMLNGDQRISIVGQTNNVNQQNFATEDLLGVISTPSGNRGGRGGSGGGRRGGGSQGGGQSRFGGASAGNFLIGQQSGITKTNALGINFSDKWSDKLSFTGSYFFNQSNNSSEEITNRQYFLVGDSSRFYNEADNSSSENQNHRVNMRLEYKIDSANTLIITPNISFQKNNSFSIMDGFNSIGAKNIISETGNQNISFNKGYNFNNNILYRHAFPKRGRSFSINLNTGFNKQTRESYLDALNRSYEDIDLADSLQQFSDRLNDGYQLGANLSYTEPVGKKGQLQFSYRPSVRFSEADQQTFQSDAMGKYSLFDTSLSNTADNRYITQNGGVSYRLNNKTNQFSFGLAYQSAELTSKQVFPYEADVNKKFSNLLPNASWNWKMTPKSSIRLMYRSNTNAPSINQLQDVINNNNPLMLRTGNPDLRQQFTHNIVSRYTYTNTASGISLLGNLQYQKMDDYIGNATYIAYSDSALNSSTTLYEGAQLIKPVNMDGYWSFRSFVNFGIPIKAIKSSLNWNNGYNYSKIPGLINGAQNFSRNQAINTGLVLASNISEYIDFTVSYNASFNKVKNSVQPRLDNNYLVQNGGVRLNLLSKGGWVLNNDLTYQSYSGLSDGFNQDFWLWNMSVGKKFLKKQQGELRLSVFDMLNQNQSIARNVQETYIEDVQTKILQQYFMLTFTYKLRNFGK